MTRRLLALLTTVAVLSLSLCPPATLAYGQGYQVYCANPTDVTLTLTGKLPTTPLTRELAAGWHFLPALNLEPRSVNEVFPGVTFDQALRYDPATGAWTATTDAHPGEALFLHVTAPSTWTPPLGYDPVTRFVYDGDGGRVKQITPAGTTTFLGEAVEIAPSGVMTEYLFVGGQRIAAIERAPQAVAATPDPSTLHPAPLTRLARWWQQTLHALATILDLPLAEAALPPSSIRFYHGDHLGSTNLVTDGAGQVVEHTEYTPFGAVAVASSPQPSAPSPFKFTGQRLDSSTGLYFYHARYYDPALGRFIQPDSIVQAPADPQTLNRYSYVRNNPVKYTDPSGHFFFLPFLGALLVKAAIGAVVGAALNATVAAFTGGDVGKAALLGAVGGAILGAGAAVAGAWTGATALGRAVVMAGAGALSGTAGAAMSGQPLGQGAAIGAGLSFVGSLVPTPNIPFFGQGDVGGLFNPVLNEGLKGAVMGAGAAAIQGESIGRGAAAGAAFYAGGAVVNSAIGHAVGSIGSGFSKPKLEFGGQDTAMLPHHPEITEHHAYCLLTA